MAEFSILEKQPALSPRYNIAPHQGVWALRVRDRNGTPRLDRLRWGLLSSQRPDGAVIMARLESIATRQRFAAAFRRRRCLLVADGFYEWKRVGRQSFPYYVHRPDGAPFAIAAIWEAAPLNERGHPLDSCAIITRPARPPVDAVHDRMPAIVAPLHRDTWLDPTFDDVAALQNILAEDPGISLVASSVGTRVNSPSHDDPECIAHVAESQRRGEQLTLALDKSG